jgi:hypothetical protein
MRIKNPPTADAVHNLYLWGVAASYALPGNASMQFDRTQASRIPPPMIPESESSKINPELVADFSNTKSGRQPATIHHESTTNSPSKNHVLPPISAKNPCKTTKTLPQKKPVQNSDQPDSPA